MRETPVLPNDLEALKAMAGAALRDREVALREQGRQQRRCEELELELLLLNQKLE